MKPNYEWINSNEFYLWTEHCEDFTMFVFKDGRVKVKMDDEGFEDVRQFPHFGQAIVGMSDRPRHAHAMIKWMHFFTGQLPISGRGPHPPA